MREVRQAERFSREWGQTLFGGWTFEHVVAWMHTGLTAEEAVLVKQAGLDPSEVGWHWEDQDRGDLCWRLRMGSFTVDEVILEAIARRSRES